MNNKIYETTYTYNILAAGTHVNETKDNGGTFTTGLLTQNGLGGQPIPINRFGKALLVANVGTCTGAGSSVITPVVGTTSTISAATATGLNGGAITITTASDNTVIKSELDLSQAPADRLWINWVASATLYSDISITITLFEPKVADTGDTVNSEFAG